MSQPIPQSASGEPLAGQLVTVIGGSGFLGRHVAQELLSRGARLRIVSRNPQRAWRIRPLGALGQVQFVACDLTNAAAIARTVEGASAVVNLVGAFKGNLDALQGKGAGRLAAAASAAGARAFVHVSAIGADADSRVDYARTKAEGEAAVLAAFPGATVLRPSILFGPDDSFLSMFAGLIARFPALPVFGPSARLQPLFVDDAAEAVARAVESPEQFGGKTFEIAGPEVITMLELNRAIARAQGRNRAFIELPDAVSGVIASLPLAPISADQWALLSAGNVASGALPGLAELGIRPRPLGLYLDRWMVRFRKHGRFGTRQQA